MKLGKLLPVQPALSKAHVGIQAGASALSGVRIMRYAFKQSPRQPVLDYAEHSGGCTGSSPAGERVNQELGRVRACSWGL